MLDIKLPVNISPIIRCYRIHAYLINIMMKTHCDEFEKYIISNYLCLHNRTEKISRNYLDFHLNNNYLNIVDVFKDNSWFDIIQLNKFDLVNYKSDKYIQEIIISMLRAGYYILQNVNEGCFQHSLVYGQDIATNICMLYGYNEDKNQFYILDYNKQGHFGSSVVSSREYFNAFSSVPNRNRLNFIKAKDNISFDFDFDQSIKLLNSHINSTNAYQDHNEYLNHIFGYRSVERSLREVKNEGMNITNFRVILEHKNILLKYFQYVTDTLQLVDGSFFDLYKKINEKMNIIFIKIVKKLMVCPNENNFDEECDAIRQINEAEADLISKYISNINNK